MYGHFLRVLVKQAPLQPPSIPQDLPFSPDVGSGMMVPDQLSTFWPEPLDFSAMSYNEVNETVTNSDLFSAGMLDLGLGWEDQGMWTDWLNLPDFGFP